jgi:hypothetical protein
VKILLGRATCAVGVDPALGATRIRFGGAHVHAYADGPEYAEGSRRCNVAYAELHTIRMAYNWKVSIIKVSYK